MRNIPIRTNPISEVNEMAGSSVPRRALGRVLHDLRTKAGKSQLSSGLVIDVSPQTIGRMEDGQSVKMSTPQMKELLAFYGATATSRKTVLALLREVKASKGDPSGGWWRAYADEIATDFDYYLELEKAACRLRAWRLSIVPGLVQTAAYRRAIGRIEIPSLAPEQIEKRIEWAAQRQTRIGDPNFDIDMLLSEGLLLDRIGDPAVMVEQLHHLADISELPNVSVRVVPFETESHLGSLAGSFSILEFPPLQPSKLNAPPVVYVEGFTGALYQEGGTEVDRYRQALQKIGGVALDQSASRSRILAVAKEYAQ
ncbi:helix-turn-helix domain-containing protein [Nocardia terpenica]|uniref:helix-turn-helix domain-containing protein n=2 Tax=Nocardia terpenica TaxID=455432 RepID=UPI002B4B6B31|nr:helix-turn-helix transcriptional regulator [Nocardia terpenica]